MKFYSKKVLILNFDSDLSMYAINLLKRTFKTGFRV